METKTHIRQQILAIREAMTTEELVFKSEKILQQLIESEAYRNAFFILTYVECRGEVMTTPLICQAWKDGKEVYCPKVEGDSMEFYSVANFEELEVSAMGIREPAFVEEKAFLSTEENLRQAICIVPGVAFDKQKHRIGYGKGYYDRYLSDKKALTTIAVSYDFQLLEDIPVDTFDQTPNMLYTETQTIG